MKDYKGMTRRVQKPLSLVMAIIMAVSIVLSVDIPKGVNAAYYKTFTKMETYKIGDKNSGYYMVPDQPGKYPVLFLFHGAGQYSAAPTEYKKSAMDTINKWIALGYMDPMIVIMPEIGLETSDDYWAITANKKFVTAKRFEALMDSVRNGGFTDKVDTTKKFSAAGFSQGGSTALYVGTAYPDDVINVGAASPSWCYYQVDAKGNEVGYVKKSEIKFSKASNAHLFIGNGTKEDAQFPANVSRYLSVYSEVKGDNPNDFVVYNTYASGHNWETFKREIFYFLYYTKFNTTPTSEIIEEACKNSNLDYEPYDPSQDEQKNYDFELKTVSSDMTVDHKSKYTLSVEASGQNIQNISYEWQYATTESPNTWTKSDHTTNSPSLVIPSASRDILYRCVVKNGDVTKTSNVIRVNVKPLVKSIQSSLTDGKVEEGKEFTISVTAEGQELKYQWLRSSDNKNWETLSGKTSASIKEVAGKGDSTTYYRCKVTSYSQTVSKDIAITSYAKPSEEKSTEEKTTEETNTEEKKTDSEKTIEDKPDEKINEDSNSVDNTNEERESRNGKPDETQLEVDKTKEQIKANQTEEQTKANQTEEQTNANQDTEKASTEEVQRCSEWIDGQWYDADGKAGYEPKGQWKKDETGYWYEDSSGWYPQNQWQKIDGQWYYFTEDGYMDYSEYRDGYWLRADGSWDEQSSHGKWCQDENGWWYEDDGWYPKDQNLWIDGVKYYFNSKGYWKSK